MCKAIKDGNNEVSEDDALGVGGGCDDDGNKAVRVAQHMKGGTFTLKRDTFVRLGLVSKGTGLDKFVYVVGVRFLSKSCDNHTVSASSQGYVKNVVEALCHGGSWRCVLFQNTTVSVRRERGCGGL